MSEQAEQQELTTVHEILKRKIESFERYASMYRSIQSCMLRDHLEILQLEVSTDSSFVNSGWIWIKGPHGVAAQVLDIAGLDELRTVTDRDFHFYFDVDRRFLAGRENSGLLHVEVEYKRDKPCRKAIVTQTRTIEVCGQLDESAYDSVIWVDDVVEQAESA